MVKIQNLPGHQAAHQQKKNKERKEFVNNLLVMGVILLLGVIIWLVVDVFVLNPDTTVSPEVARAARRINPFLDSEVLDVIDEQMSFSADDLSLGAFPIFLDDSLNNRSLGDSLALRIKDPVRPDDFTTVPAEVEEVPQEDRELFALVCLSVVDEIVPDEEEWEDACGCALAQFDNDYHISELGELTIEQLQTWALLALDNCI
jgi:hypothetical protein